MSRISELFAFSVERDDVDWRKVVAAQHCPFSNKRCYKVRKSEASVAIGTCCVAYGPNNDNVIICPHRMLERKQIITDCIHLLTLHSPGNELHLLSEVAIPGGNVDYVLASVDSNRKVKDFVGIEIQTLDTTGSIWPERERALAELGIGNGIGTVAKTTFGMNWKMTAKTILMQLHHKINTFEHLNRHLVLVVQDRLLDYIKTTFDYSHISTSPLLGDSMHLHSYTLKATDNGLKIVMSSRHSTNSQGITRLLGLNADANVEFDAIAQIIENKLSDATLFSIV